VDLYDVAVVGGGPAGSACATLAARAGLSVLLIDREIHPRDKPCGDRLGPGAWETLEALGLAPRVRALPHAPLARLLIESPGGETSAVALAGAGQCCLALARSGFDALLMEAATNSGATVRQGVRLRAAVRSGRLWTLDTDGGSHFAHHLVAADGRNSTVCRLLRIAPPIALGRVAVQAYAPLSPGLGDSALLCLRDQGYASVTPVGGGRMNVCLVTPPRHLQALRSWAEGRFGIDRGATGWHTVAPLGRGPVASVQQSGALLVVGDAARVVEPVAGEGIQLALRSGELAAAALVEAVGEPGHVAAAFQRFSAAARQAYRQAQRANLVARLATARPVVGRALLAAGRRIPRLFPSLTTLGAGRSDDS
jgi:flavin-dependent dehydrogenase